MTRNTSGAIFPETSGNSISDVNGPYTLDPSDDTAEESAMERPASNGSVQRDIQPNDGSDPQNEIAVEDDSQNIYPRMSTTDTSDTTKVPEVSNQTTEPRNLKESKKSVSIAPLKITRDQLRGSSVQSEDRSPPAYDSDLGFTERTPLLAPCRSLPSVVGYDSARSVYDYPGPSTARSEDGRTETRRRKKRMRKLHRIQAHKMR